MGFDVTPDDVLKERIMVTALDRVGGQSALKVNGAAQLSYMKGVPANTQP